MRVSPPGDRDIQLSNTLMQVPLTSASQAADINAEQKKVQNTTIELRNDLWVLV